MRPCEAGIKADLWSGARAVAFAVFHYDVEDQQLTAVGGGINAMRLLNADKTMGQGFELDFAGLSDRLLAAHGGASYNDTEIDDPSLQVGARAAAAAQ